AGTAMAMAGGALLVFGREDTSAFEWIGLAGALTAGLGYAVYAVATKRLIGRGMDSTEASAWQFSIGAVLLAPLLAVQPMGWLATPSGALMALHLGIVCTGVAYLLYGWGLRTLDTATATTLTLAEPVTAALLAVVVLDERLAWFGWAGAGLVAPALVLVGSGRQRPIRVVPAG
ncbi:MAG: DMT family transporter, partial [Ilumatobacteraceae bacterium]